MPWFSIISGPVNSGKVLLLEFMKNWKEEKPSPSIVHIDLRTKTFRDTNSFSSTMIRELGDRLQKSITEIGAKLVFQIRKSRYYLTRGKKSQQKCCRRYLTFCHKHCQTEIGRDMKFHLIDKANCLQEMKEVARY